MTDTTSAPASLPASDAAHAPSAGSSRWVWVATLFITLAIGLGGYAWKGRWDSVIGQPPELQAAADGTPSPEQVEAMVAQLAERMKTQPDDLTGWRMLSRAYLMMGRWAEAETAVRELIKRQPDDVDAKVDLADILAMKNERRLGGEPTELLKQALQKNPKHIKALALMGAAAFEKGQMAEAARWWQQVVDNGSGDSEMVQQAKEGVSEAVRLAREKGQRLDPALERQLAQADKDAAQRSVAGRVELAPDLASRVQPDDTVFIFARDARQGDSGMPLAIVRRQVRDLPLDIQIDDRMAMGGGPGISSAPTVKLTARVSRSGQALPQSGDLEGSLDTVTLGQRGWTLRIDRQRP